jgi:tetratricopeptide (TPR) repeat protein
MKNMHLLRMHPASVFRRCFDVIVILLAFACGTLAQPGEGPTVAEVEARYNVQLTELSRQIANSPANAVLYTQRAKIYVTMFHSLLLHKHEGRHLLDKAIGDFSTAIEITPSAAAHLGRVGCSQTLLWKDPPPRDRPADSVNFFLRSRVYDGFLADFENALALSSNDDERKESLAGLARLLTLRARNLAIPEVQAQMRALGIYYSVWDEFDRALAYTKQMLKLASDTERSWPTHLAEGLAELYATIASAAYRLAEYDRALAALEAGQKYVTARAVGYCVYYALWGRTHEKAGSFTQAIAAYTKAMKESEWNCRNLLEYRGDAQLAQGNLTEALADYSALFEGSGEHSGCPGIAFCTARLPIKRAQVYLRLNMHQNAVTELDLAIEKAPVGHCPQILLMRAKALRLAGDEERALADEQRAAKLEATRFCVEGYIEGPVYFLY